MRNRERSTCSVLLGSSWEYHGFYTFTQYATNMFNEDYHLLGDDNHHSHRRGNLKSYMFNEHPRSTHETSHL
jgi:hypothetical protein